MPIIGCQQSPVRIEKDATFRVDFGPDFMQVGYSGPLNGRYQGSLTSEPFSEDVSWYVMNAEIGIQPSEIDEIGRFARQEARPVHALDRRFVLRNFK